MWLLPAVIWAPNTTGQDVRVDRARHWDTPSGFLLGPQSRAPGVGVPQKQLALDPREDFLMYSLPLERFARWEVSCPLCPPLRPATPHTFSCTGGWIP